eukprot:COSAG02_NODE_2068_length_9943_cov_5.977245_4_plen_117_part_00
MVSLQEQLEQATRDAGLPPDDPMLDPLGASRKLRARGENNKVAKSTKRKNDVRWNHGYIVRAGADSIPPPRVPSCARPTRCSHPHCLRIACDSLAPSSCARQATGLRAGRAAMVIL